MSSLCSAKAASTFNLNIEALSEHVVNRLKFNGPLAALAIRELKEPTIVFPKDPTDPTNLVKTTKWQRKYNHAHDQQKWWDENTQKIYNLVMQHSTPEMKTKLQHKINTKSSSESELVSTNQALSSILHTRYFIKAQCYSVEQNILFQDNQSTMRLEVNGSFSSSKRTKHIKCRYYFICDKVVWRNARDEIVLMKIVS
jgi:hypothetical protein